MYRFVDIKSKVTWSLISKIITFLNAYFQKSNSCFDYAFYRMDNGRLTGESQEEVSIDCVDQEIQSIVPDESTTSAAGPSKDRASDQTKNSSSYNSKTYPPLGATASFPSKTENILGQKVQTVDGQIISAGEGYASLVRIKKTPISGDDNAYICNVLPTPALDVYNNILPPMEKVGRFIKYPEKKDIQDRHETYIRYRWPLEVPSPEDLATAGMFYMGKFINISRSEQSSHTPGGSHQRLKHFQRKDKLLLKIS